MLKRTVLVAALALALAAAGAATAAVVTHKSTRSVAASRMTAGRVTLHATKLGKVLATSTGRTLYLFMADHNGRSACYGQCATYWPPLLKKGTLSAGAGLKAKLLGTTKRKNGTRQVTYNGHPLYGFKLDTKSGQVAGQAQDFFGGKWYVVSSAGRAITKPAATTTTGTTTTAPTTTYCPYGC
jgi:predicted lipoprotein with Yx(FWY)xxD motif